MKQNHNSPAPYYLADRRYSFSLDNLLGKGATGNVYKGHDHKQNQPVAVKVIETRNMNQVQKTLIENQKQSLQILKHDHIMKLHHIDQQPDFTFIVSQIYEGGSLKEYLQKKGRFGEQQAMEFFRKIILGYCAVVEANIIHRDLKPTNILLTANNEPVIIDFGYSQIIVANKNLTVFNVGSPSYMSPEAYNKTIYSEKSDVWSLGAIFYELLMNTTLDNNMPIKQYFQSLSNSDYPPINFDLFGDVSRQILKGALAVKPEQRITSHRIKYLLDKQIIGKKLCSKILTQPNSFENNIPKYIPQNAKSMKNFQFMPKQIDFSKLRAEEEMANMKRKPMTMKAFTNVAVPTNLAQKTSLKVISVSEAEVIQGIIKDHSSKRSIQKGENQFNSVHKQQTVSGKNTPSISRIDFNPVQSNKNATSTISYVERRFDTTNANTSSNLIMGSMGSLGSRESSKNISTLQIYSNGVRNTLTNSINGDRNSDFRSSTFSNDYFNQSTHGSKNFTYNEGFYHLHANNNVGLASSVERKPILSQNDKPLSFSSEVRAGATRYVDLQNQQNNQCHNIDDLSNTFQNKKTTKRLSFAQTFKEKAQINDYQPVPNPQTFNYNNNAYNQDLHVHKNQNSQFKLSFKTLTPANHVDMRQGELKNLNKPKRPQNNFESQNILNFRQKPQSYQTPKSYQDLASKKYQADQPYSYQKAHYPPKPVSTNQVPNGYERMSMQNQGQNWINQPVMQFHQGGCHLRNSSESDSRNILSLRKII